MFLYVFVFLAMALASPVPARVSQQTYFTTKPSVGYLSRLQKYHIDKSLVAQGILSSTTCRQLQPSPQTITATAVVFGLENLEQAGGLLSTFTSLNWEMWRLGSLSFWIRLVIGFDRQSSMHSSAYISAPLSQLA